MPEHVLKHLAGDAPRAVERLRQLLAIPSVSTDPAYEQDVRRAAEWVAQTLRDIGLDVSVHETPGHPIVLGRTRPEDVASADAPRALFYGHYDVQPPDPLPEWQTPPFEPDVRGGAIYARGACDDKGQVCCFIEALRAWKHAPASGAGLPEDKVPGGTFPGGKFPVHVTVLIEGEEECGSKNLRPFLEAQRAQLQADIVLISDTSMWDRDTPAITYGLRGLLYFDLQLHGPNRDLHSGVYGGTLANPATMLTQVLGRLFDAEHRVTIPAFYDDVLPVSDQERTQWAALGFDEHKQHLAPIGVAQPFGESGYSTLERRWARPSCDINGLYGGYGGPGAKTVIPSFAGAKVSFRLAPNQDPVKIGVAFEDWLRGQEVHGCTWQIQNFGGCRAVVVSRSSPFMTAAMKALERSAGRKPVLIREGATIPVVGDFKELLGLDSLLIGFGLNDDRIHSPNEKFELDCFHLGCRTHAVLLSELAQVTTPARPA